MTFKQGDRLGITFQDMPAEHFSATVLRVLSDAQEGMAPEIEDYVAFWMDIQPDEASVRQDWLVVTYGTDFQYSIAGRQVSLRKL